MSVVANSRAECCYCPKMSTVISADYWLTLKLVIMHGIAPENHFWNPLCRNLLHDKV